MGESGNEAVERGGGQSFGGGGELGGVTACEGDELVVAGLESDVKGVCTVKAAEHGVAEDNRQRGDRPGWRLGPGCAAAGGASSFPKSWPRASAVIRRCADGWLPAM